DDAAAVGTVEVGPRTEMQPGSSGGRGATGGRNHQVQYSGPVSSEEENDLEALFVKVKRVRKEKKSSTGAGEETERSANQAGGSGRVMAGGKTRIKARSKNVSGTDGFGGGVHVAMSSSRGTDGGII
ncbi:DNA cross-link repair 1A protein, partial [Folsomia candida]